MAVSHSPAGFAGTVDEIAEARRFGLAAPPFRVMTVNDWAPSADPSVNRQVDISAGQAAAYGVADVTTVPDSVTFAANNGTQNRYDALVATFAWAANAGAGLTARTVTFRAIAGTTAPPQPNTTGTVDNTKINRIRGVQYDALIAIVRVRPAVGLFSSGDVVDCRMWGGYEGYANTGSAQYLGSLDTQPASLVRAVDSDIVWTRNVGAVWGFEKWIGSDKTKQPMISLRSTAITIPSSDAFLVVGTTGTGQTGPWISQVDHGTQGGSKLLTLLTTGQVRCEVPGRIRIDAYAYSDLNDAGMSEAYVDFPAGGGSFYSQLDDGRQRATGYHNAGLLRQGLNGGPLVVTGGEIIGLNARQTGGSGQTANFDFSLSVTYV